MSLFSVNNVIYPSNKKIKKNYASDRSVPTQTAKGEDNALFVSAPRPDVNGPNQPRFETKIRWTVEDGLSHSNLCQPARAVRMEPEASAVGSSSSSNRRQKA
jgi:hypothetical protein